MLDVEAQVWKNSCVDGEMNGRLVRIRLFCYKSFRIKLRVHYALGSVALGYFLKDPFLMDYSISKIPSMDHFMVEIYIVGS